jgi:uncharacterized membrane protein YkoI
MRIVDGVEGNPAATNPLARNIDMKRKIVIPALIIAAGVATAGGLAVAKQAGGGDNDALASLAAAQISLGQAVAVAEAQAAGRATRAELDSERGAVVYEIEVVTSDSRVFDVKVDAADGKVLSSKPDARDRGEDEESDD